MTNWDKIEQGDNHQKDLKQRRLAMDLRLKRLEQRRRRVNLEDLIVCDHE